ncbi:hypothetical protein [[Mycoplasma] testudinis]|uniref:hypothetical protein n=1 Tax=[Mycoplasma] testudinis TaxID=33924 RepID=UPI000695BA3F|nr:hypothetical protein [[Mycoplasma] testudinis]
MKKWSRIICECFLIAVIVGIYFVQSEQFAPVSPTTQSTDVFRNPNPVLDILVVSMPRQINWAALVLFALGWILWEIAWSRYGNRKIAIASMVLVFCSLFLTMNLISYVFGVCSILLMTYFSIKIPWSQSKDAKVDAFVKNKEAFSSSVKRWKLSSIFKKK